MTKTEIDTAKLNDSWTQEAFGTVRKCVTLYGMICAIILGTVTVAAFTHHSVSSFMWIRGVILLAIAPLLYRMAVQAAQGVRRSYERLETVTAILPIAVIVVDLIPGVCPTWYAAMQAICVLPLIAVAIMTRNRRLRSVFPHQKK
jgi:hypothetical protein